MKTEKEILEGNKIIAEFMGLTVYEKRYPRNHGIGAPENNYDKDCILEKLKYHKSWDVLMPVVEKIESKGLYVKIDDVSCTIEGFVANKHGKTQLSKYIGISGLDSKIESVWGAMVEFIKNTKRI